MKHKSLIEKMTLEEKASLLSGVSEWQTRELKRLHIPSIYFSDGPNGIRKQEGAGDHLGLHASVPATCFPTAATVANSWDEELAEELGRALAEEAAALGVDVILGPGLNIKRSPLCGRNFEYFSEDPYLSGKIAAAYIRGIQKNGIFACPKHFAVNNQETQRMTMNAVLDERTLREIYLEGFEIAIKEGGARTVMTSYNEINGVYANENWHLLQNILREEWQFDGIVVTDWGGSNNHIKAVACRSNLEMPAPGLDSARQIVKAVKEKRLSEEDVDTCVGDILTAAFQLSEAKEKRKRKNSGEQKRSYMEKHHKLAEKAAAESIVLLKNEGVVQPLLPIAKKCRVALIGDFAETPRYQGTGSSIVNAVKVDTIKKLIGNYDIIYLGYEQGYVRGGATDTKRKEAAVKLAQKADVVVYCFGLDEISEVEGMDRTHMRIPQNQSELLEELAVVNKNIVGVLSAGAPVEMPWQAKCRALVYSCLSGQAGAKAILDVLTGKKNPSGKLSETFPVCYEDTPAFYHFPTKGRNTEYREGIFVGYRYYDTAGIKVAYPFGYGMSYTEFAYSDLEVTAEGAEFIIANIGSVDGAEIAQMYVSAPKEKLFRPEKELKGFRKIFLKVGESKKIKIPFDDKTFRYWNIETEKWETETGKYTICIGANILDIRLSKVFSVEGTREKIPYDKTKIPSYYSGDIQKTSRREFEHLIGRPVSEKQKQTLLGPNDPLCEMRHAKSRLARFIYRRLENKKRRQERKGKPDLNILFLYNIPFRGIAKMTHGAVNMEMVDGMVEVVNGKFGKGMKKIIIGFFLNRKLNKEYEKWLE